MRVSPLPASASHLGFGAIVEDYSESDFKELESLVYEKLVVVIKNQQSLSPQAQYKLTKAFDPASESYGHGSNQALLTASVLQNDLVAIPAQVRNLRHSCHISCNASYQWR
jgi:alpha-ketoglutarate-dependent taurine dioxygenase